MARTLIGIITAALVLASPSADAALGWSRALETPGARLTFTQPALPPAAFPRFCSEYPMDCRVRSARFRPTRLVVTRAVWKTIAAVNAVANAAIRPAVLDETGTTARWRIAPAAGNCHDFAVTKRHMLIAKGVPASHLLLAEVVTAWGEHHLVLVVRTTRGDFVLDNLAAQVRPWRRTDYRWVRIQSPENPSFWSRVAHGHSEEAA